jgi:hypothetical protein
MRQRKYFSNEEYNAAQRARRAVEREEYRKREQELWSSVRSGASRKPMEMEKRAKLRKEIEQIRWVA